MINAFVRATTYTDQAQVTNWPARIGLVVIILAVIALAVWGMRRGWVHRQERQAWIPAPRSEPVDDTGFTAPVPGLFIGTAIAGDWMDRVAVHDLGVRSRVELSWGDAGVWFDRTGARGLFVPAADIVGVRTDRGVAGTVKAKDSVIVLTWRLGDAVVDTGYRADATADHRTVLDGLTAAFSADAEGQGDR